MGCNEADMRKNMFDCKVDKSDVEIKDNYAGRYTHLMFDYEFSGITRDIAGKFLVSLCDHVCFVRDAGEKLGVNPDQLKSHDWTKFSLEEFPYYARQFTGDKGDPDGFARAWLHHQNNNLHHWEYWITRSGHSHGGGGIVDGCLRMPREYVLEMVADWMGASMAYTGSWDMTEWLTKNLQNIKLHPSTREDLNTILAGLGYK